MKENAHHFIGISIPSSIQTELQRIQKHLQLTKYYKKVTNLQDFHITLLFLGGWEKKFKEKMWNNLQNELNSISPFSLSLLNIGYFGKEVNPRVIWVGVEESNPLHELQKKITSTAEIMNFPIEKRPYKPHITLAKSIINTCSVSLNDSNVQTITWGVDAFHLFEVNPGQSPMYKTVSKIQLTGYNRIRVE
ncbi:RNA 2',3'-cyclic phosphodiesterase [Evansella sp. AB-rgal1]|uniref:RNA 2',3'-cyclic phosphodiesterase n=1 Tax=Evansella sp. AB-rgal1 TaxID=3242696 RepID=UPI00359CE5D3